MKASVSRTSGGASACSRRPARSWAGSGRRLRIVEVRAKPVAPALPRIAAAGTPAPGEMNALSAATSNGPLMKMTSCSVASRANAVARRSGVGAISGHIVRTVGAIGGAANPATAAAPIRIRSGAPAWASPASASSATPNAAAYTVRMTVARCRSTSRPPTGAPAPRRARRRPRRPRRRRTTLPQRGPGAPARARSCRSAAGRSVPMRRPGGRRRSKGAHRTPATLPIRKLPLPHHRRGTPSAAPL